jgi:hypothetical protein
MATSGGRFANLSVLYGYMYALPGKKRLFMGSDIGPRTDASCRQFTPLVGGRKYRADKAVSCIVVPNARINSGSAARLL